MGAVVGKRNKNKKSLKTKDGRLSAPEKAFKKLQSDHRSLIRSIFVNASFNRITGVSDKGFKFDNQTTDVDDIFVYENVFVIAEYTCTQTSSVGNHLKNKKHIYDKILSDILNFLKCLIEKFPSSASQLTTAYHVQQIIIRILYCSRYDFDEHYRANVPGPVYMDYPAVRYFAAVADAVRKSARFELLHFLRVDSSTVGQSGKIQVSSGSHDYTGSLLPEAHSHFDDGFKIVSFYADPDALLRTAYVLRKDGWRDTFNLYQRMISKTKVEAIRSYLKKQKRVFINNIIVTLPPEVKPLNDKLETVDTSSLNSTAAVKIKLPNKPNSIGIIDGQHRVFAYHETNNDDSEIALLRVQQNLLVTGIIYPATISDIEREKFEARLFLEINSTQTNAKSHLKQAIGLVLEPFAPDSIAARVLTQLSRSGPLEGWIEQYFFDSNKLKTSSIVDFGLKPLVKTNGIDSIFTIWMHQNRDDVAKGVNDEALTDYISFCVDTINRILIAVKKNLSSGRWTTDVKIKNRVLTTTYVNSFLITLRFLIANKRSLKQIDLENAFKDIDNFAFGAYHSSQYNRMAAKIVETHFGVVTVPP